MYVLRWQRQPVTCKAMNTVPSHGEVDLPAAVEVAGGKVPQDETGWHAARGSAARRQKRRLWLHGPLQRLLPCYLQGGKRQVVESQKWSERVTFQGCWSASTSDVGVMYACHSHSDTRALEKKAWLPAESLGQHLNPQVSI